MATPKTTKSQPFGPAATITRRASDRLRAGHPWVYLSDIESLTPAIGADSIPAGSLSSVLDTRGIPLGTALYSDTSQIALRLVSENKSLTRQQYLDDVRERVEKALKMRENLTACRLIFSEADQLPGIVVDRYNDLVIMQLLTQGTAQDDVRKVLLETIVKVVHPQTLIERPDPRIRELENLDLPSAEPLFSASKEPKLKTIFEVNGLSFQYDAASGQKTGAFLDQRENYAAAARHAHGRGLDVCTYQGGFALHLAQHCEQVTGIDVSRTALEVADANLQLNPHLGAQVDWIEADAFELLRSYSDSKEEFSTIVLDPPAFAKSKRAMEGAMRGYKELNLRAFKMLREGGVLVTCSCSQHISLPDFTAMVTGAAVDAGRRVQVLETRGAAVDHPAILTIPETNYLKCLILKVL